MKLPENKNRSIKQKFYTSMFFDEFIKRDIFTNKGLLLGEPKKVWAFNAGNTFTGNPKWLFIYINKYRKDIDAYWLCDNVETVDYVRSLGYKAYAFNAGGGIEVKNRAGVFVTEQVKEQIPIGMENAILLNLYHGVGCKSIERKVGESFLGDRLAQKYIRNNEYLLNHMLFLVTSPLMEEHFKSHVGVSDDMVIRAGYPRCIYQKYFPRIQTFNHNIIDKKKRDKNTKIVVYSPTYREDTSANFMNMAIPDMDALEKKLKENNLLFIFKMHPFMENDMNYLNLKEKYANSKYFLFWDNFNDFYEVMDKVDLAIIDYSSIFYDFMAAGVKNFVRYFYDYANENNLRGFAYDCKEMTCGKICENFDELLNSLDNINSTDSEKSEYERIYKLFWEYSSKDSMDKIIDFTLNFEPKTTNYPTLYSFDIFDTVISRKGLHPHSIFYKIKEKLETSELDFDPHFVKNYVEIRIKCEQNAREYYDKTLYVRKSFDREITLDEIIERMAELYSFSDEKKTYLKKLECAAELDDCIPIEKEIKYIEKLIDDGEDVVLISDMYLPKELIVKMLAKVSEKISKLPLFLSSEYKVQKTTCRLYYEVYKSFPFYKYGKWIHHGDNFHADKKMPEKLGIQSVYHIAPKFSNYETQLVNKIATYDAYLVAAKMARFRAENKNEKDYFCYAYASLMFVPYVIWTIKDAEKRGIDTLYFISRDGHHLKRIADKVIEKTGSKVKTKYIYGSRKAWRIPSFVNEFDDSFFLPFGNVESATNFNKLLKALSIDYETFIKIFPNLSYLKDIKSFSKKLRKTLISVLSNSDEYREYLLNFAKEKREIIDEYFKQEMNFDEKFAFVEYWGRGYTQTCHTRLINNLVGKEIDVPYYYMRSIYPTIGHDVRYNYTDNNASLIFVEALFANIDYKSIEEYAYDENGKVVPVKQPADCDMELLESLNTRLVQFCDEFLDLPLADVDYMGRALLSFGLEYFKNNQTDPVIISTVAPLIDAVGLFGEKREFAPVFDKETVDKLVAKEVNPIDVTSSVAMSIARSDDEVKNYYHYLTVVKPKEDNDMKKSKRTKYKAKAIDFNNKLRLLGFKNIKQSNMRFYKLFAKKPTSDTAVFFGENAEQNENYIALIKELRNRSFEALFLPLKDIYSPEQIEIIAKAKYIFTDTENEFFALMKFRKETKVVHLYRETFPVSRFGVQDIEYGKKSDIRLKSIIYNVNCSVFPVSGKGMIDVFNKAFNGGEKAIKPIGASACALYFDDEFIACAKKKVSNLVQDNKKIILYMPKASNSKKSPFNYIDIDYLQEKIGDEYSLLVKTDDDNMICAFADRNDGFSYLLDENISTREAAVSADVIVGDYQSEIIETMLLNKPIIFTGFYEPEKCEIMPEETIKEMGALVAFDTFDLVSKIKDLENFEALVYDSFKEKYFDGCNKDIVQRILER